MHTALSHTLTAHHPTLPTYFAGPASKQAGQAQTHLHLALTPNRLPQPASTPALLLLLLLIPAPPCQQQKARHLPKGQAPPLLLLLLLTCSCCCS
jgi:hypothetical protein